MTEKKSLDPEIFFFLCLEYFWDDELSDFSPPKSEGDVAIIKLFTLEFSVLPIMLVLRFWYL